MGAFMIVILKISAAEVWELFEDYHSVFKPFRDATMGICTYKCTIEHCLQGLEYAIKLGWYDYETFNVKEYEYYEQVDHGNMNWIVPGKFMAFSGPSKTQRDEEGWRTFTPEDYAPIFKKMKIETVVRLNNKIYDREVSIKV